MCRSGFVEPVLVILMLFPVSVAGSCCGVPQRDVAISIGRGRRDPLPGEGAEAYR